ncbi:MAG TPA: type II toxin-antitoxin system MqsA family antitoxin [Devosia sp.]|nr:type II toxin-antitoxin system MqsA family antitoxin [Devosia sp.]
MIFAYAKNEQEDLTPEQRRAALLIMRDSPMTEKQSDFAEGLLEGLEEALRWKRGEIELEVVEIEPMPIERIRAIRRKVARTAREFEERFGIPASTVSNWEQGRRKPDPAARLLLKLIEQNPELVERAAHAA